MSDSTDPTWFTPPTLEEKARESSRRIHHAQKQRRRAFFLASIFAFAAILTITFITLNWDEFCQAMMKMGRNALFGFAIGFTLFLKYFYVARGIDGEERDNNQTLRIAILTALPFTLLGGISGLVFAIPKEKQRGDEGFAFALWTTMLSGFVGAIIGWRSAGKIKVNRQ